MRIMAYVHGYLPHLLAGSETMLHELLLALDGAGHEVAVTARGLPEYSGTEAKVDAVPVRFLADLDLADEAVADWVPDVILSHHDLAQHAHDLARDLEVKSITLFHNDFPQAHQMMKRRPDLAVVNSHWIDRRLAPAALGLQSVVVHPPVDRDRHRATPGDAVTMVNMYRMKGANTFWRLAKELPHVPFIAVKGAYGPQVLYPGYANVEVVETTADMAADVWARTRVLIMPSRYESYGKVAVEAMASGIPVVAATTPGLTESVGAGGSLIHITDPLQWHRRVKALATDPGAWDRASAAALARSDAIAAQTVTELADWVESVERLDALPG